MKTINKFLMFGTMTAAIFGASVTASFAQDECEGIYATFTANYKGPDKAKLITAKDSANSLVEKCSANETYKEPVAFAKKQIPVIEKKIGELDKSKVIEDFQNAIRNAKTVNADVAFQNGKQLIDTNTYPLDVAIVLASIGFDKASANPAIDTYNADTLKYAKSAVQQIEAGKVSESGDYGLLAYIYGKNAKFTDAKSNALGAMNYTIAYILANRQNMQKEALPYFYKTTQYKSGSQNNLVIYDAIADVYKKEYNRLDDERTTKAAAVKALQANKDATPDQIKAAADEVNALLALQKGYADRLIDTYGRAYKIASADPANKAYKDDRYAALKALYNFRFDGKNEGGSLDAYIASTAAKPMPDPTTAVTPVAAPVPVSPTTTGSTSTTVTTTATPTATSTTKTEVKTTMTAKPEAAVTTTKSTTTKTVTPATKTPVTKKKNTR